ncbi:hypothetical protein CEUSTIGMA_g12464.t1 [Chlamydomonas eustigma]|uniref:Retrovirus-related Pol polyprotein from transposon TNT 1-94-like beta-barrel domain-containing protein n=1 Tax=Chlamydomonas eustigma TaxID=1157962 RepID=A0A250XPN1_9CHLO|nr:hypothetical protein CEUSTIGMA_g12464.t1 [Chlamydomonas eustigma]|eukprot:GAX85044.1 hypothetical protein CEUSTIGMA_g12464.t1 [Chlamydomonas eustigma]
MTKLSSIELEPLDDNWPIWSTRSTRMEFALDRKGLWDVITAERITEDNAEKDRKAKALIGQYVKDHLLFTVKRAASAREALEALKELYVLYVQRSVARKQELRIKLTNLRMLPEEDMARYVERAQQLSADLQASREDATAMAANQRVYKRDARQRSMRHDNKYNKESRECHYCHKVGHIKKNCWYCWKYQQEVLGQKGPKTTEKGNIAFAASSFSAITSEVLDQVWIVDSGASSHLTSRRELLQEYTLLPYATSFVVFGDGVKKPVAGTGTAIIQTKQGTVTLKNVLHVPDACANLVSIGNKAAEAGVNVTFHHGGCKLQSGTTVRGIRPKGKSNLAA